MKKIVALSIIVVLLCTGCASNVTVTTEQNDLIAEYVSGVLLKYSFENEWQYTKFKNAKKGISNSSLSATTNSVNSTNSKVSSTGSNSSTGSTVGSTTSNSTTSTVSNSTSSDPMAMIIEGLGLNGANISYKKYVVGAAYPQGDLVLSVPASPGEKVVAIEFEISNPTATAIVCNTASNKLVMKLLVNNEAGVSESFTILKNDLINLNKVTINPGATFTAAALFIVPDSKANSISSLSLSVAVNGGSAVSKKLL